MRRRGRIVTAGAGCAILFLLLGGLVHAQEHGSASADERGGRGSSESAEGVQKTGEHEFHRNHFGGFLGGSTHTDTNETAFTIGLEYARQFSRRWAVSVYLEQLDSDLERDTVLLVGPVYYPARGVGVVLAAGLEGATRSVEEHGETTREEEVELIVRLGAAYGFRLSPTAAIGPALFGDWTSERWTIVFGVSMVVGF